MKQLLSSALTIWILSATLHLDTSFAKAIDSEPPFSTQGHLLRTWPGPNVHQITDKSDDDDHSLQGSLFSDPSKSCRDFSDDSQQMGSSKNCTLHGDFANCSSLNLWDIPQDLPVSIRVLDLADNCLQTLFNHTFDRYSGLECLNLSNNLLRSMNTGTFYNLSMLKELNLSGNFLHYQNRHVAYTPHVFCPLRSLTSLDLSGNNFLDEIPFIKGYPDTSLSCLTDLETLNLDGLAMNKQSSSFGAGFRNLTKLTTLTIKGGDPYVCDFGGLYSHSFQNLETLESLTISRCGIKGHNIFGKPFHNLKKLRKLDISCNSEMGFGHLQPIFDGLYHLENLTELNLGSIVNRYSLSQCLDVSIFQNFPRHLTTLRASGNNLEAVEEEVIGLLPVGLTTLDLSDNRFTVGNYLRQLNKLKYLTSLNLNVYSTQHNLPYSRGPETVQLSSDSHNCTISIDEYYRFKIHVPSTLVTVEINNAGLNFYGNFLTVINAESLTKLSASGNQFHSLKGTVLGLESLKYMDLSMCAVQEIDNSFFDNFKSLEVLRLDSNALGDFLSDSKNEKVFDSLANLKVLNLTNNAISVLQRELFKNLHNLASLYLRKNSFVSFDVDLRAVIALSTLDLAQTHVFTLSQEIQAYFDNLTKNAGMNVSIYMEFTPISCKCPNLQFLQWMTTSQAFSKPFRHYYCDFVYLRHPPVTDDYEETMTILRKQCASNALLLFLVVSATLALTALIIGGIVYRFRWNIRYLYYAVYLRFKKNSSAPENAREYDAFICYASEDAEFAEGILDRNLTDRGLRIFLHGRDFKAGDYVSSNIVNAVCSCKKTVVLLTEALLDSYWCGYEIEMAKLEGIQTGRPVIIFVFLENIPKRKLDRDLLYNIKNNTYVEYMESPSDPDQMRLWWDKLANDIKD